MESIYLKSFCNIINVFTDQFNASLLIKNINALKNIYFTDLKFLNSSVIMHESKHECKQFNTQILSFIGSFSCCMTV